MCKQHIQLSSKSVHKYNCMSGSCSNFELMELTTILSLILPQEQFTYLQHFKSIGRFSSEESMQLHCQVGHIRAEQLQYYFIEHWFIECVQFWPSHYRNNMIALEGLQGIFTRMFPGLGGSVMKGVQLQTEQAGLILEANRGGPEQYSLTAAVSKPRTHGFQ